MSLAKRRDDEGRDGILVVSPARVRDGSDADSIGAWPQNGIFGTQLGPNRNAKPTSDLIRRFSTCRQCPPTW